MDPNIIKLEDVYFKYGSSDNMPAAVPEETGMAISGLGLSLKRGGFTAVIGRNGSGKSTFARLLNALLIPVRGKVFVNGMDTSDENSVWEIRKTAGMIFQNPDNQIVGTTVEEDIAFGPENAGIKPDEIRRRVDGSLESVHMSEYAEHAPHLLSGGQKQKVAIAGVLAIRPECMILDEATAMLDPSGRKEVLKLIGELNAREGITIIHITHHMDEAAGADRVIVLDKGRSVIDGVPREVFSDVGRIRECGLNVPQVTELIYELKERGVKGLPEGITEPDSAYEALAGHPALMIAAGRAIGGGRTAGGVIAGKTIAVGTDAGNAAGNAAAGVAAGAAAGAAVDAAGNNAAQISVAKDMNAAVNAAAGGEAAVIRAEGISYVYMKGTPYEKTALQDVSLEIRRGEFIAIIGHTGSGKTTLVQHFNGLLKPDSGKIEIRGIDTSGKGLKELRKHVGLVFQYPEHQLFEETVLKDVAFGLVKSGCPEGEIRGKVINALKAVGLDEDILDKSPFELSGGQKRRAAIAGVIVTEPEILILDEPAAGLDPEGRDEILGYIRKLHDDRGITVILVSHNMEDVARLVERIIVMNRGGVAMDGRPAEIFRQSERLESMGLSAPQITYLMKRLRKIHPYLDDGVFTVGDAAAELFRHMGSSNAEEGGST